MMCIQSIQAPMIKVQVCQEMFGLQRYLGGLNHDLVEYFEIFTKKKLVSAKSRAKYAPIGIIKSTINIKAPWNASVIQTALNPPKRIKHHN